MRYLTDFADQAVILPLVAAIAMGLLLAGGRRATLAWLAGCGGTLLIILAGKIAFDGCGAIAPFGLHSPSGHTASAAVVYGGLAALVVPRHGNVVGIAVAAAVAALIGWSRLALGVHTLADVLAGAGAGVPGAAVVARLAGGSARGHLRLLLAGLAVLALFHGLHLPAEAAITRAVGGFWPASGCPAP